MSAESVAESIPPGYKQTEVGVIPKDWETIKLSQVSAFITKGSTPTTYGFKWEDSGVLFLRSECVSDCGLDLMQSMFISEAANSMLRRSEVSDGDVLVTITGNVGRAVLLSGINRANINQHIARVRIISPNIIPSYVYHFLSQPSSRNRFNTITTGQAYPQISLKQVREAEISLPPTLAEQEAIAITLSDTDALIESLEQLIAKKRQIKQGAMQELLTGKRRLPGFSGEWEVHNLRRFVRNFIVPMRDKPKRFAGDIPWCRIEDFDGIYLRDSKSDQRVDLETIQSMNLKVYPTGTLLVSCSADLGRCAIVARPLVSNQTFIGLDMDETVSSNLFFYYYMTSKATDLNNLSSGTTISYLSREQFEDFSVFVPLDKQEQHTIATILSDMDAEITALEEKLAKTRQLKHGMMQELLTGRIRLI